MSSPSAVPSSYALARETYRSVGVDAEEALARLDRVPVSMHC